MKTAAIGIFQRKARNGDYIFYTFALVSMTDNKNKHIYTMKN